MTLGQEDLLDALNSVTSIPIIPFRGGKIDLDAHAKNVHYLMENNSLDGDRRRVIGIAGTSLIHHISADDQVSLMGFTAEQMGGEGLLMAGVAPNPIEDAGRLIEREAALEYPPDVYLIMPLTGVVNAEGIFQYYMDFAERLGRSVGARLLYYMRNKTERETAVRLMNESEHFVGLKIGTDIDDVESIVAGVDEGAALVIWGVGDRSTGPAERGTKGHTSGINVVVARASDEINNAQRRGDFETSRRIENEIAAFEEIRFRDGRMFNYSAVVEAMHLGGFTDIDGGEGGPFNPRVPAGVADEVAAALEGIKQYH
jgi:dihydrodipicolinate synthase/N-acetylneuraminate lyase